MRLRNLFLAVILFAGLFQLHAATIPLIHAHAHNDYEHKRPLLDALDHGFCSVEADIYLLNGQLLVAHKSSEVKTNRTLQSLYLDPLRERVKKNGGRIYPNGPEFTLLIDLKTSWTNTWPVLRDVLGKYSDVLTTFHDGKKLSNAITVIISGNRSREMFVGEKIRRAAFDGDLSNLDSAASADFMPWISADWRKDFKWNAKGTMPEDERKHLTEIVAKAHARGRKVRFWAAPDVPALWRELRAADVDMINTDDLAGLEKYFIKHGRQAAPVK